MILFTPLISMLMTIILSCLVFLGVRKSLVYEMDRCIKPITQIQAKHRNITKRLLSLNYKAKTLRSARRKAERAYRLATPHYKPIALAALLVVKSSQKVLRGYQMSLIAKASMYSLRSINYFRKNNFIPIKPPSDLKVEKTHSNSDSPSYRLKSNYQKEKEILFLKRFSTLRFLPNSLKSYLEVYTNHKILNCGSTLLEKDGEPWHIKLILDKL